LNVFGVDEASPLWDQEQNTAEKSVGAQRKAPEQGLDIPIKTKGIAPET
jgi:hypothetical protein